MSEAPVSDPPQPEPDGAPRRIVTGHDADGRSMVLSDAPNPKTLDVGTAAFHEVWITDATPTPIAATEPEPTDRPVRTPPPAGGGPLRFPQMAPGAPPPLPPPGTRGVGARLG